MSAKNKLSRKSIRRGLRKQHQDNLKFNRLMDRLEHLIYRAVEFRRDNGVHPYVTKDVEIHTPKR